MTDNGITDSWTAVDAALAAWATEPNLRKAALHINRALRATGDLQRALILEQLKNEKKS